MDISSVYNRAKDAVSNRVDSVKKSLETPNAPNLWTPRGGKSALNDGKYDIKNHSYPNDLMAPDMRYGGNYVMFYINVATESKLFTVHKAETVSDYSPRDRGDLIGLNMSREGLTGSVAAVSAVEAAVAGGVAGGAKAIAKSAALGGGVAAVGVGVASTMAPDAKRSQKRLKTAIALHIPNQLSIRYGVQWSDDDTGTLAMANTAGTEIMKAIQGDKKSDVLGSLQSGIASAALSKGPQAAGVSAALGLAANPKKEQIFKGVDFRTFSFDYQFFPRDIDEAANVLRIIEEFKYHMHPEFKDTNNFIYVYPSEFDISYFANGKENPNLHRHTSCVLTDININYTPNGVYSTFPNGMPTQINLTLNFRELALLTKDKIKDGL